jgi:hypothetical protein
MSRPQDTPGRERHPGRPKSTASRAAGNLAASRTPPTPAATDDHLFPSGYQRKVTPFGGRGHYCALGAGVGWLEGVRGRSPVIIVGCDMAMNWLTSHVYLDLSLVHSGTAIAIAPGFPVRLGVRLRGSCGTGDHQRLTQVERLVRATIWRPHCAVQQRCASREY